MTNLKRNKKLHTLTITGIASVLVLLFATNSLAEPTDSTTYQDRLDVQGVMVDANSDDIMAKQQITKATMSVGYDRLTAVRGQSLTVPVTFSLDSEFKDSEKIVITFGTDSQQSLLFSPSSTIKYSEDEKLSFLSKERILPNDVIDLYSLTTFDQKELILSPGQSGTVNMKIAIPENWPDDVLNEPVIFNVNHEIMPHVPIGFDGPIAVEVTVIP